MSNLFSFSHSGETFSPHELFALQNFFHKALFEGPNFWDPLIQLKSYFDQLELGIIKGEVQSGAFLIHPELISIGQGSVVEPGATIIGPCFIGENCQVRQGAYLRGHVLGGDRCVFGHSTEVKHSIFLDGAQAGHFAYVGDSILGNRVNLGAGTKCANLRFDKLPIKMRFKKSKIETPLKKCGVLMGDDAQTGCNAVTAPGTILAPKSIVMPLAFAKGWVGS